MKLLKDWKKLQKALLDAGIPEQELLKLLTRGRIVFSTTKEQYKKNKSKFKKLGLKTEGSSGGDSHGHRKWFHVVVDL